MTARSVRWIQAWRLTAEEAYLTGHHFDSSARKAALSVGF